MAHNLWATSSRAYDKGVQELYSTKWHHFYWLTKVFLIYRLNPGIKAKLSSLNRFLACFPSRPPIGASWWPSSASLSLWIEFLVNISHFKKYFFRSAKIYELKNKPNIWVRSRAESFGQSFCHKTFVPILFLGLTDFLDLPSFANLSIDDP